MFYIVQRRSAVQSSRKRGTRHPASPAARSNFELPLEAQREWEEGGGAGECGCGVGGVDLAEQGQWRAHLVTPPGKAREWRTAKLATPR